MELYILYASIGTYSTSQRLKLLNVNEIFSQQHVVCRVKSSFIYSTKPQWTLQSVNQWNPVFVLSYSPKPQEVRFRLREEETHPSESTPKHWDLTLSLSSSHFHSCPDFYGCYRYGEDSIWRPVSTRKFLVLFFFWGIQEPFRSNHHILFQLSCVDQAIL